MYVSYSSFKSLRYTYPLCISFISFICINMWKYKYIYVSFAVILREVDVLQQPNQEHLRGGLDLYHYIYLSIYPPIYPSIYLSIYRSFYLLSIDRSIYLSIYKYMYTEDGGAARTSALPAPAGNLEHIRQSRPEYGLGLSHFRHDSC